MNENQWKCIAMDCKISAVERDTESLYPSMLATYNSIEYRGYRTAIGFESPTS